MSIQLFSIFNRRVPDGKYSILAVRFPTCRHCHELTLLLDAGIEASACTCNSTTSLSTLEHRVQIYFQAMHLHADWWVTSVKWSSWRSDNMRNILINISVCVHDWCFSLLLTLRVSAWLISFLCRHKQDGTRSVAVTETPGEPPGFCQGHMQTSSDTRQDNSTLIEKVCEHSVIVAIVVYLH